eukprot:jgi/Mesvir1/14627/Mv05297-RA.1
MIAVPKELIDRIMRAFPDPAVTKADMLTPKNDPDAVVRDTFDRNILPLYSRKGGNPFFDKQGHVAEPGDTWKSIAAKYGVSADDLVIANPHIPPLTLSPGNFVLVPKKYGFNEFVEGIIHPDTNMNLQYDGDAPPPSPSAAAAGAAAAAPPTAPAPPPAPAPPRGFLRRGVDFIRDNSMRLAGGLVGAGAGYMSGGGIPATVYGAAQGAQGNWRNVAPLAVGPAMGYAASLAKEYVPESWSSYIPDPDSIRALMATPAAQIATKAGVAAAMAAANAQGGWQDRLGAAGLSMGASLAPGAAVALAGSKGAAAAVQSVLERFGLSSVIDAQSVLQAVKMFGPGFLRSLFPPDIDPKLADSAIGQIVDSLYNSHLWGQYLQQPSQPPVTVMPSPLTSQPTELAQWNQYIPPYPVIPPGSVYDGPSSGTGMMPYGYDSTARHRGGHRALPSGQQGYMALPAGDPYAALGGYTPAALAPPPSYGPLAIPYAANGYSVNPNFGIPDFSTMGAFPTYEQFGTGGWAN